MLKGIDVSEWQGDLDFTSLKATFDFALARAGFGTARADNDWARNRDGLRGTGQDRGWYWYSYPNSNTPEDEAAFCATVIGQLQAGELVALDFEEAYSGDPVQWCLKFLQKFESLTGYKPLLYINLAMVNAHDWSPVIANNNGLWLADWDQDPNSLPADQWPVTALKQYTDNIQFMGKTVDADVFEGDDPTFKAYGYKPSSAPNTGGADMYGGLDLNNKDSMKVCVDVFNKVQSGQFIDLAKYTADLKTKDDTIKGLNTTIDSDNTTLKTQAMALKGAQDQVKILQPQADKVKPLTDQLAQATDDRKACQISLKSANASNSQLKLTSYTTAPASALVAELVKRIYNRATFKS